MVWLGNEAIDMVWSVMALGPASHLDGLVRGKCRNLEGGAKFKNYLGWVVLRRIFRQLCVKLDLVE